MNASIHGTIEDFDSINIIEREGVYSIVLAYSRFEFFEQNKSKTLNIENIKCSGNEITISNLTYFNSEESLSRTSYKYGDGILFQYYRQRNHISIYKV